MKIDEREIERLSDQLESNQYTGQFYGQGDNNSGDFKTCILRHLEDQDKLNPGANPFPVRVNKYIAGNAQSDSHTICQFYVDYDLFGGLHIAGLAAYQQTTSGGHLRHANEHLKTMSSLPTKQEVLGLPFTENGNPVTSFQVNEFVKQLKDKGYDGDYYGPNQKSVELEKFLTTHLATHSNDKQATRAFPFWMGTITDGIILKTDITACAMQVRFNPVQGLIVDRMKSNIRLLGDSKFSMEQELKIYSTKQMPTKDELNAKVAKSVQKIKKKSLKF